MEKDYDALAAWAEHDMNLPKNSAAAAPGDDAAAIGRDLLERVGRPALDPDAERGTESPRRQVRLPRPLSEQVDEIAERQGRNRPQSCVTRSLNMSAPTMGTPELRGEP